MARPDDSRRARPGAEPGGKRRGEQRGGAGGTAGRGPGAGRGGERGIAGGGPGAGRGGAGGTAGGGSGAGRGGAGGTAGRERFELPVVPLEERRRLLELPPTAAQHRELVRRMPFMDAVELRPAGSGVPAGGAADAADVSETRPRDTFRSSTPGGGGLPGAVRAPTLPIRVVAWNAARCAGVDAFARVIAAARADVVLLTEMDWGMARSGQLHTTRELAARLGFGYAYAVEFLELGLGDERERAAFAGQENAVGYHGGALLARGPLMQARRIALEEQGGWFGAARGQRRVGGRMALAARTARELVVCSVHLESESDPAERSREVELLLDRIDAEYPGRPVIIGGDFNTFSISKGELDDPGARARRYSEDPERYLHPIPYEPFFALAERRGYDWRGCNAPGIATHRGEGDPNPRGSLKLDWFLCRGVRTSEPRVLEDARASGDRELSDHAPISVVAEA